MADYNAMFNHPLTILGAQMMGGFDPNRQGLGGFGAGLAGTGQVMRQQAQLDEENERARALADLQMQTYQAKITQQQRDQEARTQKAEATKALLSQPGLSEMDKAAIQAGYGENVMSRMYAESKEQSPLTQLGKIAADEQSGFLTPEQAEMRRQSILSEGGRKPGEAFKEAWGARKDITKQEAPFREVASRAKQIMQAVTNPGPFSDITMANNIAKFLDPGSVVRPSETQTIAEAGGLVNSIQGALRSAAGKGEITPAVRAEIKTMMDKLLGIYESEYQAQREDTKRFLERRDMPLDIMGRPASFPDFTASTNIPPIGSSTQIGGKRVERLPD